MTWLSQSVSPTQPVFADACLQPGGPVRRGSGGFSRSTGSPLLEHVLPGRQRAELVKYWEPPEAHPSLETQAAEPSLRCSAQTAVASGYLRCILAA